MSRKKEGKTLAMRVLEGQGVPYQALVFPEDVHDAQGVAEHTGYPPESVYKTLVVETDDPDHKPLLVMIDATSTLDLKKLAAAVGVKKAAMARHADAERLTGLQVGGISALALLNKGFDVYLDELATLHEQVLVSAGQRGINLRLPVADLIRVTGARLVDVVE
jgi:Cys-tRNA(Pro)/Cys-tRNA(Cys) deacylase